MSVNTTIFLTSDNEHCYIDGNNKTYNEEGFIGNAIILEMSKSNISIVTNNEEDLIIEIAPGTEIYNIIRNILKRN